MERKRRPAKPLEDIIIEANEEQVGESNEGEEVENKFSLTEQKIVLLKTKMKAR